MLGVPWRANVATTGLAPKEHGRASVHAHPARRTDRPGPTRSRSRPVTVAGPSRPVYRTSGLNGAPRLYSRSRGQTAPRPLRPPDRPPAPTRWRRSRPRSGPGSRRRSRRRRRPRRRAGPRSRRAPHADPRADRQRQDPGRIPVVPRPARRATPPPAGDGPTGHRPRPLRLAAQGADLRRRAQPAGAAGRHRPRRRAARRSRCPAISVATRTGDTSAEERRDIARRPPDILITTPESLYLHAHQRRARGPPAASSTSSSTRSTRSPARSAAPTSPSASNGSSTSAGRAPPQRIGLSATQRPLETIARFLGGVGPGREVTIVDAGARKPLELQVDRPGRGHEPRSASRCRSTSSPAARRPARRRGQHLAGDPPRILELIRAHRSTIVFTNSRRLAERLAQRLNELAGEELVRAHHGSIAREQRLQIEEDLKAGPAAGARRDEEPRARHRHGRRRPRHPGREPDVGGARAPAGRTGRPPGRRAVAGA